MCKRFHSNTIEAVNTTMVSNQPHFDLRDYDESEIKILMNFMNKNYKNFFDEIGTAKPPLIDIIIFLIHETFCPLNESISIDTLYIIHHYAPIEMIQYYISSFMKLTKPL